MKCVAFFTSSRFTDLFKRMEFDMHDTSSAKKVSMPSRLHTFFIIILAYFAQYTRELSDGGGGSGCSAAV